ncbi:hypothetical protein NKW53_03255 [Acetobacter orientalis]|uniref:hypothetical protein n=1 Tax=Acetobacter orientalis TaxID=146474 RepID=UPI00209EB9B0|nr:hypothetical protein [Acetobacter orientalis]MCP1215089.1 hypothetical protein [Acetobacter orientalis]MCP1218672.1 hypothetical protein [Acetobacter orientalis]
MKINGKYTLSVLVILFVCVFIFNKGQYNTKYSVVKTEEYNKKYMVPQQNYGEWAFGQRENVSYPVVYTQQKGVEIAIYRCDFVALCIDATYPDSKADNVIFSVGNYSINMNRDILSKKEIFSNNIPPAETKNFIHNFTALKTATLRFGPSVSVVIALDGTSSAITALNQYSQDNNILLPPPFGPYSNQDKGQQGLETRQESFLYKMAHPDRDNESILQPAPSMGHDLEKNDKDQQTLEKLNDIGEYMNEHFSSDVRTLHKCGKIYGESFNFTPSPEQLATAISDCSPFRNIYLEHCQQSYSKQECTNASGILLGHAMLAD